MTTQEINKEIQGLIDLLKKEGKGVLLRETLLNKMYETDLSELQILEDIDMELEDYLLDRANRGSFEISFKIGHISFEIGRILSNRRKAERRTIPQVAKVG